MSDQIKLLWKSLTGEMNTLKAVWKLIYTTIGYMSSFFSLSVLLKDLAGWNKLEVWTKEQWQILVIISFLISCIHNRRKINCCKRAVSYTHLDVYKRQVLDPIQSFLGAEVDMHRANEIRPLMKSVSVLAEKYHCAVILIGHMNKNSAGKSSYRRLGSIDRCV